MRLPTKIPGIKFVGLITIIILVVSTLGCTSSGSNADNSSSSSNAQVAPSTPNYNKTIETNPKDADAWNDKGYALYKMGKYKEAIQAYDKVIEIRMRDMLKEKWMTLV